MAMDIQPKLIKLFTALREIREKETLILEEIDNVLGGGVGVGELLKRLERHYSELWTVRYRSPYTWRYPVDRPNLKRLIKLLGVEEIERRMIVYVKDGDPYLVKARHPFGLFVSNVNTYAAAPVDDFTLAGGAAPTVADCKHAPACRDDQEHTRRKMAELRA